MLLSHQGSKKWPGCEHHRNQVKSYNTPRREVLLTFLPKPSLDYVEYKAAEDSSPNVRMDFFFFLFQILDHVIKSLKFFFFLIMYFTQDHKNI